MGEISILNKSIKDFFTPSILKIAILPFIITSIFMYTVFFSISGNLLNSFENSQVHIEQTSVTNDNGVQNVSQTNETYTGGSGVMNFLLKYSITSWLVSFLFYTVGSVFVMIFSLFISLIIVGFLTPQILAIIHQRHYPTLKIDGYGTVFGSLIFLLKQFLMMIVLFIVLMPLYFIPIINIVVFNIPFFYFFHKLLTFDVTSTLMTKRQFAFINITTSTEMLMKSIFLYLISMIPFVALFSTVFFVVYLGHNYMIKLQELND